MMASSREGKLWLASLIALPFLMAASLTIDGWRDVEAYLDRAELFVTSDRGSASYAGATWTLAQTRLIGDGRDTNIKLPKNMRLVILRLSARAEQDIGQGWAICNLMLTDDQGRRWQHLDPIMSSDLSRELDPKAQAIDGCDEVSAHAPAKGQTAMIEEKFVVPAEAASSLAARLSFMSTRPNALSIPLGLK